MTVLYPHHRHLTPRLRVFIDWLVATLSRAEVQRRCARGCNPALGGLSLG
ncbi:hypothetical protein [Azotobacter chroococcum]|nr:hypothetical protein [Azotobacter chroococcum]